MNNDIKVCHVTSAHNRYDVRIFHKECKSLAKAGFDVTLLVNDDLGNEVVDGVKINSTNYKSKNRYERMIVSRKYIKEKAIEVDADIYHFHDPELLGLASAMKRRKKRVIFDFHEDVVQQILFKEWIPRAFRTMVSRLYKAYEESKVKKYDALITVTPQIIDRLGKINHNTVMITNYPKLTEFKSAKSGKKEKNICFAGGVSSQWNHINIIKSLEGTEGVEYLLAGSGVPDYLNTLQSLAGWSKVKYLGRIPHEQVKSIYEKSTIGMSLLSYDTQVGDEGTLGNTKIFEFMEAGLPVICSSNRLWKEIVDEYNCGIAVNPDDINEIREAIKAIIYNSDTAKKMGDNGRMAVREKYNWKTQEKELLNLYRSI